MFSTISLICALALTHIYKQQHDQVEGTMSPDKSKIKRDYAVQALVSTVITIPWAIFYASSYFINVMLCNENILDSKNKAYGREDLSCGDSKQNFIYFKWLVAVAAICYFVAWVGQSIESKSDVEGIML